MARSESLASRIVTAFRVLREGAGAVSSSIDPDDDLYRRISGNSRDLNPITQDRSREVSFYLWRQNPMAHRLIEMIVDFVVGDGITIGAVDDDVLEVVTEFWTDPVMRLDLRHRDFVRDLSLTGELGFRVFMNDLSGRMRIGYIDQAKISRVEKDPENALIDRTLWLKGKLGEAEKDLALVNLNEENPAEPFLEGDAFYYAINRTTTGTRGTPDLLAIADWLDGYDQLLWNFIERSGLLNAFIWDVTLEGQDQTGVDGWMQRHGTAPRPGTVRAHNEKEKWAPAPLARCPCRTRRG